MFCDFAVKLQRALNISFVVVFSHSHLVHERSISQYYGQVVALNISTGAIGMQQTLSLRKTDVDDEKGIWPSDGLFEREFGNGWKKKHYCQIYFNSFMWKIKDRRKTGKNKMKIKKTVI